jgi:hypothetical protein
MIKKTGFSILALALAAGIAQPQDKPAEKKMPAASGILQPSMEPTGGWTSAGDMGDKPAETWSSTTVGAGVDKKPLNGKVVTVTGEILDLSCYLQLGKHGDKHASCGKKCIANGEPIGLVTKAGAVYLLMAEEHDPRRDGQVGFRKAAGDNFAKVMTVTGTETTIGGVKAVYVQGYAGK